jgi:hypothetical protein
MEDVMSLSVPIKFLPKDVEGKQPKKVGDKFKAKFLGKMGTFEVTEWYGDFFFAVLSGD